MLFRQLPVTVLLCLCAAFTDERAIVASGLVFLWHWYNRSTDLTLKTLTKQLAWYIGFLLLYTLARLAIGSATGLQTGHAAVGISNVWFNLPNLVLLIWSLFEGGWLIVFVAAFLLIDRKETALVWASTFFVGGLFVAGLLVGDSIRSQQYAFPALLTAFAVIGRHLVTVPQRIQKLSLVLTLVTPITIYLGGLYSKELDRYVHNMYALQPAYIYLPYRLMREPVRHAVEYVLSIQR